MTLRSVLSRSVVSRTVIVAAAVAATIAGPSALTSAAAADPPATVTAVAGRSGPVAGGQIVTLHGQNIRLPKYHGVTAVLFGSVKSTHFHVTPENDVTVRTPPHGAGRVYVRVVEAGATSPLSAVATYIYVAEPRPLKLGSALPHAGFDPDQVSCAAANFCAAIGHTTTGTTRQGALTYNGVRWGAFAPLGVATARVTSLSCAASPVRMCMAVKADGNAYRFNGSTWTAAAIDTVGAHQLASVSCPTSSFCMAVDAGGHALRYNGSTWTAPAAVTGVSTFAGISCTGSDFCYAVEGNANVVRYLNGQWGAPRAVGGYYGFVAISCSSPAFCLATGGSSLGSPIMVYTGLIWGQPQPQYLYAPGQLLAPPDCQSPTFCLINFGQADYGFDSLILNGDIRPIALPQYSAIGCWAAYACLLVNSTSSQVAS